MPTTATATSACSMRRGERQDDAAPPGLFVGDHVGGDHRLAVARARRHGRCRRETTDRTAPTPRCRRSWPRESCPQPAIEFRLLGHDPADDALRRRRRRRRGRPADAERRALRERRIERAQRQRAQRHGGRDGSERQDQMPARLRRNRVTGMSPRSCWRIARRSCSTVERIEERLADAGGPAVAGSFGRADRELAHGRRARSAPPDPSRRRLKSTK